jgi:hypothetical protein
MSRRRRSFWIVVAVTVVVGPGACRTDDRRPPGIIELDPPRLFEASDALHAVRDIAIGPRGDVWVVSSVTPLVHHFDSTGRVVTAFGRVGQGPGELSVAYDVLAPTADDPAVRIWDPLARKIIAFADDGTVAATVGPIEHTPPRIPLVAERMSFGRLMPVERWGRGYLLQDIPSKEVRGFEGSAAVASANLLVLDSAAAIVDTLAAFARFEGPNRPAPGVAELAPIPLWCVCPGAGAVIVDPYGERILSYGRDGTLVRTDTLPLDGRPITDADIAAWMGYAATLEPLPGGAKLSRTQIDEIVKRFLTNRRGELGTVSPAVARVACDDERQVWLQRWDIADDVRGFGREWIRLTADRQLQGYRFPARFQPMVFRNGVAYGIHRDSLDVELVGTVRIPD